MKLGAFLLSISAFAFLGGCGKETGRIRFTAEGPGQTTAQLSAGEVAFWTDIDVSFDGDSSLVYKIELLQGDKTVATTTCNPLGQIPVKVNWVSTDLGSSHMRKGSGKMPCEVKLDTAGATTVKATLWWSHKPTTLSFKKADLVLKQ